MDVISILQDSDSKFIVMPIVAIIAGILIRILCQNDKVDKSIRDWFYWAPSLLVSNFILICSEFSKNIGNEDISKNSLNALVINIIFTIAICIFIRKFGWNFREKYLTWWCGIIWPNAGSVLLMYIVLKTMRS